MSLIKKNLKNILLIVIVILFVYTIIFKGDFSIILDVIRGSNYRFIAICIGMALSYYALDAISLLLYTRIYEKTYSFISALIIAFISPFFNGITPFASGGQVAQVYVYNKQKIEPSIAVSIMLMHFIIYQFALVFYSAMVLILQYDYFISHFTELFILGVLGFCVNSTVIIALLFSSLSKKFQEFIINFVFKIGHKLHIIKDYQKQVDSYNSQLSNFRKELNRLSHHKGVLISTFMINILRLTIMYMVPFFAFKALSIDVSSVRLYVFIGVTSFVSLMTSFIPIPGASGGSEALFTTMYGLLFGNSRSSRAMLVWRFATYYLMMFVGAFTFIYSESKYEKKEG